MGGIGCFMVCFVLAIEHVGYKVACETFHSFFLLLCTVHHAHRSRHRDSICHRRGYLGPGGLLDQVSDSKPPLSDPCPRDWQSLQMVAYLPLLSLLGLWFLVPESPRWLIGAGRLDEAKEGIRKAARCSYLLKALRLLISSALTCQLLLLSPAPASRLLLLPAGRTE